MLAEGEGAVSQVAAQVSGMLAVGGSTSDGLRVATVTSRGPGVEALAWLAVVVQVIDRSGAPAAAVLDEVAAGLLDEVAARDECDVALAGARATASVLSLLPLVGLALGAALGVNVPRVLLTTPAGAVVTLAAALLWSAGRVWSARLVRSAERAGA